MPEFPSWPADSRSTAFQSPALVHRERLLRQVWAEQPPRAVLILAPSGYGKSVLLAQAAALAPLSMHLSLNGQAASLSGLIQQLVRAVQAVNSPVGDQLREAQLEEGLSPERAAALLAPLPAALITVDHAENLGPEGEAWLLKLLRLLPAPHRMAVAARALSSGDVSYLLATQQLRVIGPEELAFQADEMAQLGAQAEPQDSWPLGVMLGLSAGSDAAVHDLLGALVQALPAPLDTGLASLAPYPLWTPNLPASLGLSFPADWPTLLVRQGLPVTRQAEGAFQPHGALLDVLDRQLGRQPEERRGAYRRAAAAASAQDHALRAVQLLVQGGLGPEATALAEETAGHLVARGEYLSALDVTNLFTAPVLAASPLLTASRGLALIETQQIRAGLVILQTLASQPEQRWRALIPIGIGLFRAGRYSEAEQYAAEAEVQRGRYSPAERVTLLTLQGNILRELGRPEDALALLLSALRDSREQYLALEEGHALLGLNVTYLRLTRADAALEAAMQATVIFEQLDQTINLIVPLLNTAVLLAQRDETQQARTLLLRALGMAETHRAYTLTNIHFVLGDIHRSDGDLPQAERHFMKAVEHGRTSERHDRQFMAELLLSETLRQAGQEEEANRHVLLARQLLDLHPSVAESRLLMELLAFHEGQLALSCGDLPAASVHFGRFTSAVGELKQYRARAAMHAAEIARRQGELTRAHLDAYMTARKALSGWAHLKWDLNVIRPTLEAAVKRGWYADELHPFVPQELRRMRLTVQTLGALSITVDGQPLHLTGSSPRRAQELIALLALLPGPTSRDLHHALIGEGRGDHRNALTTARQSLIRATGIADAIYQDKQKRYRFSPDLEVQTDLDLVRRATAEHDLVTLRKVLRARPEFLPGIDSHWAADLRDTDVKDDLQQAYHRLGPDLGDHV